MSFERRSDASAVEGGGSVTKKNVLIQLDTDVHPSSFDRIVAIDAGADEILSYGGVKPEHVRDLVHGAIFTRGGDDLRHTAVFIGGSDVTAGERLLEEARKHLLPDYGLQVSILFDANGCNTTAAAAVRAAANHLAFGVTRALVLGGTGPVGQRVSLLLARLGAKVRIGSRRLDRAEQVAERIRALAHNGNLEPTQTASADELLRAVDGQQLIVAAGAAGVVLLPKSVRKTCGDLKVAIDLNAVPPLGVEEAQPTDKGTVRDGVHFYGALGVGGTKMKIHKAAVARLFESNDALLDAEQIYGIAQSL